MLKRLGAFLAEPPAKETIQDEQKVSSMYKHWRWRIFYSSFINFFSRIRRVCSEFFETDD